MNADDLKVLADKFDLEETLRCDIEAEKRRDIYLEIERKKFAEFADMAESAVKNAPAWYSARFTEAKKCAESGERFFSFFVCRIHNVEPQYPDEDWTRLLGRNPDAADVYGLTLLFELKRMFQENKFIVEIEHRSDHMIYMNISW